MAYQTSTNLYNESKYIVDAAGTTPYATVQSAINAANAVGVDTTVFIRDGAYTENLTLYDKVNLKAFNEFGHVIITGLHTPPAAGYVSISNIYLESATHILSSVAAGTTTLEFYNCNFNLTDGYIFNLTNWTGSFTLNNCNDFSTVNGVAINTSTAILDIFSSRVGAGATSSLTISGGLNCTNSAISCPISITGTGTGVISNSTINDYTITLADTSELVMTNSTILSGANAAITTTSTGTVHLLNVNIESGAANAITGTGIVNIAGVNFSDISDIQDTVTQLTDSVTQTGNIYATNFERMDMTGFYAWAAAGPYFDDTTLGTFQLLVGGTGYIHGRVVTWVAQNIAGMTSGSTWYIYIDSTGTIGKTDTRTYALYEDNIVLFECLYDETSGTKLQHTVRDNHPYNFPASISNYQFDILGTVLDDIDGANITLVAPANVKISITGASYLYSHGLITDIADTAGAGVTWKQFYTTAAGKWAVYTESDTFNGYYNDAGTPTALPAGKFGIYVLAVLKDNETSTDPIYVAVLDDAYYDDLVDVDTAIANGTVAKISNELLALEPAQLGYIAFSQTTGEIVNVVIAKTTASSAISTGGTDVAALVSVVTSAFDGILSAADTTVQAALNTIDEWGKTTTDHALLIGNGTGVAIGSLAVGDTREILIGNTGADPSWSSAPTVVSMTAAAFYTNVPTAGLTLQDATLSADGTDADININITAKGTGQVIIDDLQLTTDLAVTEGGTGVSTFTDHGVLVGSGAAAITALAVGATGEILVGSTGADPSWSASPTVTTIYATTFDTNVAAAGVTLSGTTLSADGTDADISINITAKGTGKVVIDDLQLTTDLAVTEGGTGASTLTDGGVLIGAGAGAIEALAVGATGTILTGVTGANPAWTTATYPATATEGDLICASAANTFTVLSAGTATYVLTANGAGAAPTWQAAGGGGITWSEATGATQAMAVDNGYIANNGAQVVFTLPDTAALGKVLRVAGKGAGGWKIEQNAGETIYFGTTATTTGVTGYLESTEVYDAIELLCITADTDWVVLSTLGNITVA